MAKRTTGTLSRADAKLVEEVRELLKGTPIDLISAVDSRAGLCCGGTGTVAIVRIEKGRPPERRARGKARGGA